jgi:2-polyprenyl-3-methyl-5-hydroxy-6-metoxy-1,4-benzoquinol methylase
MMNAQTTLDERDAIQTIRDNIYTGPGYHVVRNFLPPMAVAHIRDYWSQRVTKGHSGHFDKYSHVRLNGPDISLLTPDRDTHYNFFWNKPRDVATSSTAWQMQTLRNAIEGNPADHGFLPHYVARGERQSIRYAASYRVVFTRQGGEVKPHCDWALDHAKVQMCLILTSPQRDYLSGGTLIDNKFRNGDAVNVCEKENLQAGDLLVFRFAHRHGVAPVVQSMDGMGYGRMILPEELIDIRDRWMVNRVFKRGLSFANRVLAKMPASCRRPIGNKSLLYHWLRPIRRQGEERYYDDEAEKLMQIAIREGIGPSLVYNHRGLWARMQPEQGWQLETLKQHGLMPRHHFLDVGCGIMRLGMPLISYLDDDRYCGIDALDKYVRLSKVYMREVSPTNKKFSLMANHNFEFEQFGRKFDYAMANSVITHLSYDQIEQCFKKLKTVMNRGARFLFTVIINQDKQFSSMYASDTPMTKSSHRDVGYYEDLSRKLGFDFEYLGQSNHPAQHLCVATF